MSDFSERLRGLRGSKSQKEFAEFLGISTQQTYGNYEKGRTPKTPILQQISQRCGVNLLWLERGEGEKYTAEQEVKRKNYKGAFEALVKQMPKDQLYARLHELLDEAEQGNDNAFMAAQEAFNLIGEQKK